MRHKQPNSNNEWQQLRKEVVRRTEDEAISRVHTNPHPTEIEVRIGAFIEELEPQVRNAVVTMAQKGYSTESSGFYGVHGEMQQIDGYFTIDAQTKKELAKLNVHAKTGAELGFPGLKNYTGIGFYPDVPDLTAITKTWDAICEVLPKKDPTIVVSTSGGSEDFRKKYAPDWIDIELLALEKNMAFGRDQWDNQAWDEFQRRRAELTNLLASPRQQGI